MRSFVDADGEVHVESVDGRTLHGGLLGSAEVDERDKSFEAVVRRERRVAQDVRDVRRAEHVQTTSHTQGVKPTVDGSEEVNVSLAVSLASCRLLRVDEKVVGSTHAQVESHGVHVGKVE